MFQQKFLKQKCPIKSMYRIVPITSVIIFPIVDFSALVCYYGRQPWIKIHISHIEEQCVNNPKHHHHSNTPFQSGVQLETLPTNHKVTTLWNNLWICKTSNCRKAGGGLTASQFFWWKMMQWNSHSCARKFQNVNILKSYALSSQILRSA